MAKRDLINITDLSIKELEDMMALADDMIESPAKYSDSCRGKKLATLFYEPSTRTRLSFESAMLELGGSVLGFADAKSSSAAKGETVSDTAKVVSYYADVIVMRHPNEGTSLVASRGCDVPVVNAGDGGHFHPTQTLTDLFTIHREKGRISDFAIGLCGDLKFGRTVHSLIAALLRYSGITYYLISPEELKLPAYIKAEMNRAGAKWIEATSLEDSIPKLDVLYMTRIQQERFSSYDDYFRLKDTYVLDTDKMAHAKSDMIIMHPLPRVNEIARSVDSDLRARYFEQVGYGKVIRKALMLSLLDGTLTCREPLPLQSDQAVGVVCRNPRCITNVEDSLPQHFRLEADGETLRCEYCDIAHTD